MARFLDPSGGTGTGDTTLHTINVKNASNADTLARGTVVMFAGAAGDTVTVAPADATADVELLVGITHEEIAPEGFGEVVQFGVVEHVKTDYVDWDLGDLLYLDPATPGGLTVVQPASGWTRPVAAITRVQQSSGRILVRALPTVVSSASGGGGFETNFLLMGA
jgi:hypothetical protein